MNHYVVAPDGQKYGPADLATLNAWIVDNRLHPQSFLEEEGTGRRLPASAVPGLRFVPVAPAIPPTGAMGAYPRYGAVPASAPIDRRMVEGTSHGNFLGAVGISVLSLGLAFFLSVGAVFFSLWAIRLAWNAKEEDEHPAWWVAMLLALAAIGLAAYVRFQRYR